MRRIGVRELRQNASQYIRLVKAGESVEVAEHGTPVAVLAPPPERRSAESDYERLVRQGRIRKGTQDRSAVRRVPPLPGSAPTQEILDQLRAERL